MNDADKFRKHIAGTDPTRVAVLPESAVEALLGTGKRSKLVRHIVELDDDGKPMDECLCGHVWDRAFVKHGDEICQACVDESRRRGSA